LKTHPTHLVKTTIDIPEDRWKKFSIAVIEDEGARKKNDIINQLIEDYLKHREKEKAPKK
jgi:metal-responsive CopG/Arc/MetJ family transcriptional regulator